MRIRIKLLGRLALGTLLGSMPAGARTGTWHSYTNMNQPNAMVTSGGFLFVGTSGGIRKINLNTFDETDFTNENGLVDVNIVGITVDPAQQVWAVASSGMVSRYDGDHWTTMGRSYKASGWVINPKSILSHGKYLALGSTKGLSFFEPKTGLAIANVVKFGGEAGQSVTSLLRNGDTLYVATGKAVYKAAVDWDNILSNKFGSIYDPQIWVMASVANSITFPTLTSLGKSSANSIRQLRGDNFRSVTANPAVTIGVDSVTHPVDTLLGAPIFLDRFEGKIIVHDSGVLIEGPFRTISLSKRPLVLGEKSFDGIPPLISATAMEGRVFLGLSESLILFDSKTGFRLLSPVHAFPTAPVGNIAAKKDQVFALTLHSVVALKNGNWNLVDGGEFYNPSNEIFQNPLKNLVISNEGAAIVGNWGMGLIRLGQDYNKRMNSDTDPCLKKAQGDNYTIINSVSDPRGDELWVTDFQVDTTHYLLARYNTKTGKVDCPETVGSGTKGIRTYALRLLSDKLMAVADKDGVSLFEYQRGSVTPELKFRKKVVSPLAGDPTLDVLGDSFDRLWVLVNQKIGYVDSLSQGLQSAEPLKVKFLENISGHSCRTEESDGSGGIWVGCENGLFHIQPHAQVDQSEVERFTTEDGLLSDYIYDISVVKETGAVWIVSTQGINFYESEGRSPISSLDGVKGYPNPFRSQHQFFVIDNVSKGSSGAIFTQSGSAVKIFSSKDLKGAQFQWDGNNSMGNKVTPGIYIYSVTKDGRSAQGKIIVAR